MYNCCRCPGEGDLVYMIITMLHGAYRQFEGGFPPPGLRMITREGITDHPDMCGHVCTMVSRAC